MTVALRHFCEIDHSGPFGKVLDGVQWRRPGKSMSRLDLRSAGPRKGLEVTVEVVPGALTDVSRNPLLARASAARRNVSRWEGDAYAAGPAKKRASARIPS